MFRKVSKLRHFSSLAALCLITGVLFYLSLNPLKLEQIAEVSIGRAVGMSISVAENPYNKLALQLNEKEERLNRREEGLARLEAQLQQSANSNSTLLIILSIFIAILFVLIFINYYLDYKRRRVAPGQK